MTWVKRVNKKHIHPDFLAVMELTLNKLYHQGTPFKVYSGLRTFAEQEALYAKGRTDSGKVVTKARGGQSMHNYGLALDLAPLNLMTPQSWDVHWPDPDKDDSVWFKLEKALFEASQEIGLQGDDSDVEWGGRWKFRDVPHCQIRTTIRELQSGFYPPSLDVNWLVVAHTSFLYDTPWMKRRVQYLLNRLDFSVGVVDGIHGPRTEDAIIEFLGLSPDDTPDVSTHLVERLVREEAVIHS